MPYSEASIQSLLYASLDHSYIVPNTGAFGGIADLVSVTKAGYGHEYEIKISRADFKADANKVWKHNLYRDVYRKHLTHPVSLASTPNRFWYVTPPGLLDGLEIPEYAGHIEVTLPAQYPALHFVRKAPLLHRQKATPKLLAFLARGLEIRYWNARYELAAITKKEEPAYD